jgi:hypothetical protein
MKTRAHTTHKSEALVPTSASPIAAPPTHDEAPAPDVAAQLDAAAQGHTFAGVAITPAPIGAIQPKLTIGAADDKYEDEADRVAGQVMRMPDSAVQRLTPEDDEDKIRTKPDVQRKANGSFDAGAVAESRISARRGGGSPLPEATRAFMEPRFGADFGGVRVHADAEADQISQDLSARAFTTGSDIYFRHGEFSPSSAGGQELLAHELTHVVQQGGGSIMRAEEGNHDDIGDINEQCVHLMHASEAKMPEAKVIQRVLANRVEYQHNRKVVTNDKGHVIELLTPIDISFETEEHSEYFARERKEDQLTGLRTVRWEMDDDWWSAAKYHAYGGKQPTGRAKSYWLDLILKAHCGKMSASDGHSLTTDVKKKAPHFDIRWYGILNDAITKNTGFVIDTESERRTAMAEKKKTDERKRSDKQQRALEGQGNSYMVTAWDRNNPNEKLEMTKADADLLGWVWE